MYEQSVIDQIRESVNIVDVIGSYIPLKKAGSAYKALCPFHQEDTPSFNVSAQKQIYKCFGCGKSGNVFTFVQEMEKISFPEAVRRLAPRAGVTLKETVTVSKADGVRDALFRACELAAQYYRERYLSIGQLARDYLAQRGIGEQTAETFELGYAPDSSQSLRRHMQEKGVDDRTLLNAGLLREGERGEPYDLFRQRLIFPIRNANGRVVAFGGRVLLPDQHGGKYINSPTSDIYTKGEELYGLYQARYEITRRETAILCEGYTDLIRLHNSGFTHAVAGLGTALTDRQLHELGRYTKKFVMLYDGDKAGRNAALKAGLNALRQDFEVRVGVLPQEHDPDTFLLERGPQALEQLLAQAPALPAFVKADTVMGLSDRAKVDLFRDALAQMTTPLTREMFAREVAEAFNISVTSLLSGVVRKKAAKKDEKEQFFLAKYRWEQECIRFVMQNHEDGEFLCTHLHSDYFFNEVYREIYEEIAKSPQRSPAALLGDLTSEGARNALGELMMEQEPLPPLENLLNGAARRQTEGELRRLDDELAGAMQDTTRFNELLREKESLQQTLRGLDQRKVTRTLF